MSGLRAPRRVVLLPIVAAVVVLAAAAAADVDVSRRLVDLVRGGRAVDYTRGLTDEIGARLTGTASYRRAVQWSTAQFRDAGVTAVGVEPFALARGWERAASARGRIVAPIEQPIAVQSFGWVPSTPAGGVEGEIVVADDRVDLDPARARGRIVLVDGRTERDVDAKLQRAGALAVLVADPDTDNRIAARMRQFGGDVSALPAAIVAREDAATIRRLLARGPVRVALALDNTVSAGPISVDNVVAEIGGREKPDEWILVGAHLDSWDLGPGAQDNAAGVAMVLEAARAIAALDRRPRRSIRFALWGAEEQGLLGSAAYATAHARELSTAVAVLNVDGGTGRIIGWTTPGRDDVMASVRRLLQAPLTELGAVAIDRSMRYAFQSDGGPFIAQGIPVLDMNVDDSRYEEIHHRATDTMDRVDTRNLIVGAATVAVTAYAIADELQRFAARGPVLRRP